jgi:hypothetical protein
MPAESSLKRVSSCAAQAWASRLVVNVADVRTPLIHTSARHPLLRFLNVAILDPRQFMSMALLGVNFGVIWRK